LANLPSIKIENFREKFTVLVEKSSDIVLTAHISPDDDSIGSLLALYGILSERFPEKNLRMLYGGRTSERHSIFTHFEKIQWVDDISEHLGSCDLLIMLDGGTYSRFSIHPEVLVAVPGRVIIDHHKSPPDEAGLVLQEPLYSSTAELLYNIFIAERDVVSKGLAECFLCGILGDTGNLAFVPDSRTEVFTVVQKLLACAGGTIASFRSRYGYVPKKVLPLLKELLNHLNEGSIEGWPFFQYSYIDRKTLAGGPYGNEDMSASSHIFIGQYLTNVEGSAWGFVVTPREDGTCRISSRSLPGSVNVRKLHEALGIGGGHDQASGGTMRDADPHASLMHIFEFLKRNDPANFQ